MRPSRYEIRGDPVIARVAVEAPDDETKQEFFELLQALRTGAYPDDGRVPGILPYKAPPPNSYTVPFDSAYLLYQVTVDIPSIILLDVVWTG